MLRTLGKHNVWWHAICDIRDISEVQNPAANNDLVKFSAIQKTIQKACILIDFVLMCSEPL
jgi:hypothetical protein